ncbi:MAG: M20/M25/M40 family metallo-hydrolase [Planctomycetes bacterium]|nr:M20/M25/M40 family metallo-hydrolase [Planctomycetota bacterium]
MKRLLALGLLGLALLFAVMVTRAVGVAPAPRLRPEAAELELDERRVSLRLAAALRLQTVAGAEDDAFAVAQRRAVLDLVEERFAPVMAACTVERHDYGMLLRWEGRAPELEPLVLLAHLDVVPAPPAGWTRPPFSGDVAAGYVWGRGALDDKGPAFAMLEALELLLGQGAAPRRSVVLALGCDEETGGARGAARLAERLRADGVRAWMVLDEGSAVLDGVLDGVRAPIAAVGVVEKGYATLHLRVAGAGGHASMPPDQTALGVLAAALTRVEAAPFPARLDGVARDFAVGLAPYVPFPRRLALANAWLTAPLVARALAERPESAALLRTTCAVTQAAGGVAENVLPASAEATLNLRVHPRDTLASVVARVRAVVDDPRVSVELAAGAFEPSRTSPAEGPAWDWLRGAIEASFPDAVVVPSLVVVATDSRHYADLTDCVYRFSPLRLERDDLARLHGVDERVSVRDYVAMIRFYVELLRDV